MVSTRIYALALGALTLASCASSSAEESLPTTSAVTTTPVPSPSPVSTVSSPVSSTTVVAAAPGDVPPDVSNPVGIDEAILAIDGSTERLWAFLDSCLAAPTACDTARLPVVPGSEAHKSLSEYVEGLAARGHYVLPPVGPRSRNWIYLEGEPPAITVQMCVVDSSVVMDSLGTADSSDDVEVDGAVASVYQIRLYSLSALGEWLLESATGTQIEDGSTCSA